jgi:hypothetical protein
MDHDRNRNLRDAPTSEPGKLLRNSNSKKKKNKLEKKSMNQGEEKSSGTRLETEQNNGVS